MLTAYLLTVSLLAAGSAGAVEGAYPAMQAPGSFLKLAAQEAAPPIQEAAPVGGVSQDGAEPFTLPSAVRLYEDARTVGLLGTKLTVSDGQGKVSGQLKTKFFDVERWVSKGLGIVPRMDVDLWSPDERTILAHADADLVSYAYSVHVYDGQGKPLGSFKSDLWVELANDFSKIAKGELTKFASFYGIYDSEGKLIARSVKSQDAMGVVFYVQMAQYGQDGELTGYDTGKPVASISSTNGWTIQVMQPDYVKCGEPGKLDPRVLVMIPAYKTFVGKAKLKRDSGR